MSGLIIKFAYCDEARRYEILVDNEIEATLHDCPGGWVGWMRNPAEFQPPHTACRRERERVVDVLFTHHVAIDDVVMYREFRAWLDRGESEPYEWHYCLDCDAADERCTCPSLLAEAEQDDRLARGRELGAAW